MDFGTLLKATLKKNNIPVSRFTKDIGFNHVAIYSVFKNKRKLTEEAFEKILSSYPFSEREKLSLERAFRLSRFESERFEMMTFIKNELEMAGKTPDCTPEKSKSLDFSSESVFLSGRAEYNAAVEALLKTVNTADNPVVYTNYSYFDAETDKIVYDFAKSKDCRLVIKHSITKGTKDNMKERIHNGFSSIKFAKLGHTTSIAPQDDPPFALSAHFISEKAIVMYDEKSQKGFFSAAETVVKAYYLSAAKRDSAKKPLNREFESPLELKSFTEPIMDKEEQIVIESHMPICCFADRDILDETLKKDIPAREIILSAFWNHLLICKKLSFPSVFTQSSIKDFLESGKSYVYSLMLMPKDGYSFTSETVITVNGQKVSAPFVGGSMYIPSVQTITMPTVTVIDVVEINGVTVSFTDGDKPVFTGKVPDGANYAYRCEWWELDSKTGAMSTDFGNFYENKFTAFEAGKTYHYGVYVTTIYGDRYVFGPNTKLKINGEFVNYKRYEGDTSDGSDGTMWVLTDLTMTPQACGTTPEYKITEGANGAWTQNSDGTLKFVANGDFSKFTGVKVDGKLIDTDKYTAVSGSTVITLKKDYLGTLSVGKHTLTVVYSDGECSTEFEIKAAQSGGSTADKPKPPQTGDNSSLTLWVALLFISGGACTALTVKRKYRHGGNAK